MMAYNHQQNVKSPSYDSDLENTPLGGSAKRGKKDDRKDGDEDKRKNFLERNRQAALKCRQRKKQWLANLQQKVDFFARENEALNNEISDLRGENLQLKTILHSHRDCPAARSQLQSGGLLDQIARDLESSGILVGGTLKRNALPSSSRVTATHPSPQNQPMLSRAYT